MDFNLDSIEASVSSTWKDVTSAGVPAVIAGAESYAADQLSGAAKANQAQAQAAAHQVASQPGASSGIMASIQGVFKNIATTEGIKQYGGYILAGILVIALVARKL